MVEKRLPPDLFSFPSKKKTFNKKRMNEKRGEKSNKSDDVSKILFALKNCVEIKYKKKKHHHFKMKCLS